MFFELDDIKRRHTPYFNEYNTNGVIDPPDESWRWNLKRGMITGVMASCMNELQILFSENYKLLLSKYQNPNNLKEFAIFAKEIFKMDNFKRGIKNRLQYGLMIGSVDWGTRLAVYRYSVGGIYASFGTTDVQHIRKMFPLLLSSLLTCWISIPFETAKAAYYADKTFPKELQKGYKSYMHALVKIPFNEGIYYLFKNSFPIYSRNFVQTSALLGIYDFLQSTMMPIHRNGDGPLYPIKLLSATIATYFACALSYPMGCKVREMVEFWPKETGNVARFDGNYRKAAVWLYYQDYFFNSYSGFVNNYFWRTAPRLFATVMIADYLGFFKFWRHCSLFGAGSNSWEDSFH